jgi:hypothetical protein
MAMKWPSAAAVVLVTVIASFAHAGTDDGRPAGRTLFVRTYNRFGVPARDLASAQDMAGRFFADTGIRLLWINCGSGSHRLAGVSRRCEEPVNAAEVILRIDAAGEREEKACASMGLALVTSEGGKTSVLATVFPDRVLAVARAAGMDARTLLGMAIGHELGHLLLSTGAHAATGLMRARWSQAELRRARPTDWRFLNAEALVIRDAVTRRTTGRE